MEVLPFAACAPLQAPEPLQAVALLEVQLSVEAAPLATAAGLALKLTVGTTLTVTLAAGLVPPGPLQVRLYVAGADSAPVLLEPLAARLPLQPPAAAQPLALLELQLSMAAAPGLTVLGTACRDALGRVAATTVTVTAAASLTPPAPLHAMENAVVVLRAPVLREPLAARSPFQPPEAEQAVALAELQVSSALSPGAMEDLSALKATVGTMLTVADADGLVPPAPLQLIEKLALLVNTPLLWLPLAASSPLQAPEALQLLAFIDAHVKVDCSPL